MDLARLLHPLSCDEFFSDYWQKAPLHLSGRGSSFYDPLFPAAELDRVLGSGTWDPSELFVVKDGKRSGGFLRADGTVDAGKLVEACSEKGMTLQLLNPELRHPALCSFCNELEGSFLAKLALAFFLTPQGSAGTDVHFDVVDVLVLQIDGEKVWKVYNPVLDLPSKEGDQIEVRPEDVGDPVLDVVLEPGDFLYVPRGFPHEPFTKDCHSFHLSVGALPTVWTDLLATALRQARLKNVDLRRSLPIAWLQRGEVDEEMKEGFRDMLRLVAEETDLGAALSELRTEVFNSLHQRPIELLKSTATSEEIEPSSWVRRRNGSRPQVSIRGQKAVLAFPGGSLVGPAGLAEAFEQISRLDRFRVADLDDGLSDGAKLVLVKRLVRRGLLAVEAS